MKCVVLFCDLNLENDHEVTVVHKSFKDMTQF
jgi:hypothetical protein